MIYFKYNSNQLYLNKAHIFKKIMKKSTIIEKIKIYIKKQPINFYKQCDLNNIKQWRNKNPQNIKIKNNEERVHLVTTDLYIQF